MGESIVFTSGKGGVGKTTTIANTSVRLSLFGKKVLMLDNDMGLRNLDVVMGLEDKINYNILDLLDGKCSLRQALIRDRRFPNLYLIPASLYLPEYRQYQEEYYKLLQQLKQQFDYCMIDCPAGIDQGFFFSVSVADRIVLVTTPHISAVKDAQRVIKILPNPNNIPLHLVINQYERSMVRRKQMLSSEDIYELLTIPILGTIPRDASILVSENQGDPVITLKAKISAAYDQLALRLLEENRR